MTILLQMQAGDEKFVVAGNFFGSGRFGRG